MAENRKKACAELEHAGVELPLASVATIDHGDGKVNVTLADGKRLTFDTLYPVLGCDVRSTLATSLGAEHDKEGCLIVDKHQQTSVAGLYAIGDVVSDLHQIAVGTGHAAVAATHIHRELPRNLKSQGLFGLSTECCTSRIPDCLLVRTCTRPRI